MPLIKLHKTGAFTILELLIAMLITGIVVVGAYRIYNYMIHTMYTANSDKDKNATVLLFYTVIEKDLEQADKISGFKNSLVFENRARIIAEYTFEDQYILRNSITGTDTFLIRPGFYEFHTVPGNSEYIETILIRFEPENNQDLDLNLYKQYDLQLKHRINESLQ